MSDSSDNKTTRRSFLKRTATLAAAGVATGAAGASYYLGSVRRVSRTAGKKVIIIGIDGMDPRLSESMMREGLLPNLAKMRAAGGFSPLGTSIPPQSPVAWANFINGAGPGSHGIFDFLHRHLIAATENIRPNDDASRVELSFADWQRVMAVQMLLARYARAVSDPDAIES